MQHITGPCTYLGAGAQFCAVRQQLPCTRRPEWDEAGQDSYFMVGEMHTRPIFALNITQTKQSLCRRHKNLKKNRIKSPFLWETLIPGTTS